MRISTHVLVAGLTLCVALTLCGVGSAAAAGARVLPRAKQPRATRGFKNTEMMTARGFGKRGLHSQETLQALTMGPTDNFLEMLENSPDHGFLDQTDDKLPESVPVEWFVDELLNNPELTRTVVRKFVDTNQDGLLSPEELLRNVY